MSKIKMFILKKMFGVRMEKSVYYILLGKAEIKYWRKLDKLKDKRKLYCDALALLENKDIK